MNVLSLFDGMSCGKIALKELGIITNKYYASEIDKHAIAQTQLNFPNTIQLGSVVDVDVTKLEPIDLLLGGSPCFAAGTKVLTIDGYKNIEDIVIGEMVLTHKNRFMPVLRTGGKVSKTFTLKAQGFIDVVCTENHPFYARKKLFEYYTQNNGRKSKRMILSDPEWINAGNLKGDYYACSNIQNIESRNDMNINEDEAYVIGRYIADGHTRKDIRFDKKPNGNKGHNGSRAWQLILSVGNDKVDRFCSNIKHLHYSCYKHGSSVHRIVFSNKRLVEIVEKFCGVGSINKHFGEPIINLPKNLLSIVLKGFLDGDGCFYDGKWSVTTISPMLPMTISRVISKIYGTHSNINVHKPKEYREIMGRTVHQNTQYLIGFSEKHLEYDKAKIIEDKIWSSVKSFTNNKIQNVYNLEVLEDNSYTANNFVVHNCQSFSFAGKRNGMTTTENEEIYTLERYLELKSEGFQFEGQSYLFWEYMRILTDIRKYNPNVKFLLENVEMGNKWERVLSEAIGVFGVHINSALVSAQQRKRIFWTNLRVKEFGLFGELHSDIPQPKDEGILLKDILEEEVDEKYYLSDKLISFFENNTKKMKEKGNGFSFKPTDGNKKANAVTTKCGSRMDDDFICVEQRGRDNGQNFEPVQQSGRIRRLTPTEASRLQTIPEWYKWEMVGQFDKIYYLCDELKYSKSWNRKNVKIKDAQIQLQLNKLNCAPNATSKDNVKVHWKFQDQLLINQSNAMCLDAKETNKQKMVYVSCTTSGLLEMDQQNYLLLISKEIKNVSIAINRQGLVDQEECVQDITKCINYTETHCMLKLKEAFLVQGDIYEIQTEFAFTLESWKLISEDFLQKEKLYTILTPLKQITKSIICTYAKVNPNMRLSMRNLELSQEMELTSHVYLLQTENTYTSDSAIYRMLGNGWNIKTIMHILKYLK